MSRETENALKEILEATVQAKDFVLEQAPDVIHQLLLFTAVESIVTIAIGVFVAFISYKATFKWSNQELEYGGWRIEKTCCSVIGSILSLVFFIFSFSSLLALTKVLIAPKLFILEYASKLVN